MKNKSISKKALARVFKQSAFALATAVVLTATASAVPSTEVTAAGTGGATINGTATVMGGAVKVLIPANLDFELNPFGEGKITPTSQITATDYRIVNKSHTPVKVEFNITAKPVSGVDLVSNPGVLSVNDSSDVSKKMYLTLLGAKSFTGSVSFDDGNLTTNSSFTYDAVARSSALVPFPATTGGSTGNAKIGFVLGAATANGSAGSASTVNTLAANNKGIASFQFFARMNTYAAWVANDVAVEAVYTITTLHPSSYDALKATVPSGTLNQYVV